MFAQFQFRKTTNNLPNKHLDVDFRFASKTFLQGIATLFGPESVLVVSIDGKAKVRLQITAATCQATLITLMEYEITLTNHNFSVASKHKLVPNVYAACEIQIPARDFTHWTNVYRHLQSQA